jgi:hypothetical protein
VKPPLLHGEGGGRDERVACRRRNRLHSPISPRPERNSSLPPRLPRGSSDLRMPLARSASSILCVLVLLLAEQHFTAAETHAAAARETARALSDDTASCSRVAVKGDATFCVSESVCSGTGDSVPSGWGCPRAGSVAVEGCRSGLQSYDQSTGECVARADATCQLVPSGSWACVWNDSFDQEATATGRRRLVSGSAPESTDSPSSGSDAIAHYVMWAGIGAAFALVFAVVVIKMRKPRVAPVKIHVELEEIAISPGKPALVQTPSSTRMFVYTAQI